MFDEWFEVWWSLDGKLPPRFWAGDDPYRYGTMEHAMSAIGSHFRYWPSATPPPEPEDIMVLRCSVTRIDAFYGIGGDE